MKLTFILLAVGTAGLYLAYTLNKIHEEADIVNKLDALNSRIREVIQEKKIATQRNYSRHVELVGLEDSGYITELQRSKLAREANTEYFSRLASLDEAQEILQNMRDNIQNHK